LLLLRLLEYVVLLLLEDVGQEEADEGVGSGSAFFSNHEYQELDVLGGLDGEDL
jgi:hypothetical protein